MKKIDIRVVGLAVGCIWGSGVLVLGIVSMMSERGAKIVKFISKVYIGYGATWLRSLVGALWGFVDGAISGALVAWMYNKFVS